MTYKITTYRDDGIATEVEVYEKEKAPTLKELQEAVKGYIEAVPEEYYLESNKDWFKRQHPNTIDNVYCNEEGLMLYTTANKFFTPAPWGDSLYGNVVVVEKL